MPIEFAGRLDQARPAPGAVLQVAHMDYHAGGPHFVPTAGDKFPVVFAGHLTPTDIAEVAEFYGHSAILAFEDGRRWKVRQVPRPPNFEVGGGASASHWAIEAEVG